MDWPNLTPRHNIHFSITRKITLAAQCQLTHQPVSGSPINPVLHGSLSQGRCQKRIVQRAAVYLCGRSLSLRGAVDLDGVLRRVPDRTIGEQKTG